LYTVDSNIIVNFLGLPSGGIYKYLNIWAGNSVFGDSNNIANAVINFKVEKT